MIKLNFVKLIFDYLPSKVNNGLWFYIRQLYPNVFNILKAIVKTRSTIRLHNKLPQSASIVVVGLGPASFSCVTNLIALGFDNILVLSKDLNYGGKCVNFGCMPSEYSLFLETVPKDLRLGKLESFVSELRSDVEKQFNLLGVKVINSEAMSVQGKSVLLKSGNSISFDHLIFANGNSYNKPQRVPLNTSKTIEVEGLWSLPLGANLVIYAKNNPAALSMANSARALGLNVSLILSGANPFSKLPSWRYFARESVRKGINLIENDARLIRVDQDGISYECGSKITTISYDYILIASKPELNFISVDGLVPSMLDIDLSSSRLVNRFDISYVGDAAGFYSAAEAEEHARLVIKNIVKASSVDLNQLSLIPLSFHGNPSLAFAGDPWTWGVASSAWIEVDFRSLGWSKIHSEEGRLWYLLSRDGCSVDGIHICHPRSAELISTAIALMGRPLSDPIWRISSIHPSASEIFKLIK